MLQRVSNGEFASVMSSKNCHCYLPQMTQKHGRICCDTIMLTYHQDKNFKQLR